MLRNCLIAAMGLCAALASPADAAVTINFTGGNSATSGSPGNIASYSSGAVSVQASAWSLSGWSVSTAWLGQYSDGLGVTNAAENGTSSNSSAIDNVNGNDFVVLVFNQPVSLLSAVLTPYAVAAGPPDNDVTSSFATLSGAFTSPVPTAVSPASSVWFDFLMAANSLSGNNVAPYSTAVTLGTNYGNVWLLGADMSGLDSYPDGFHLTSISVAPSAVPEPLTWVMMLLGLALISRLRTAKPTERQLCQIA